ncbi:MAG: hypothetical protein FJ318_02440 [SAR202 cluster bacterium]|nr:hypothetical protein [SAR202 cluster bacterium]
MFNFAFAMRMAAAFAVVAVLGTSTVALAHERRAIGPYQVVVGWTGEPAYEGHRNGVDFRVTEAATTNPVMGAERTVQVEVTHLPTSTTKTFPLRTIFGSPGRYTVDILPTAPGAYRFRFFGEIGGTAIDETFVSEGAGGDFGDIEPAIGMHFPVVLPELREVAAATQGVTGDVRAAQAAAAEARDSAGTTRTLAVVGLVAGIGGIVAGAGGMALAMRKR